MKTTELSPCPFCGNADALIIRRHNPSEGNLPELTTYAVCCNFLEGGCGASGGYRETEADAIEAWEERKVDEV